jgi:hypothetical protein
MNYSNGSEYLKSESNVGNYDRLRLPYGILVYLFSLLIILLVCWTNLMKILLLIGCIRPRKKVYAIEDVRTLYVDNLLPI